MDQLLKQHWPSQILSIIKALEHFALHLLKVCMLKPMNLHWKFAELDLQYPIKLKANPENPSYDVFNPKHQDLYRNKESATDSFGIHCKKLSREAQVDVGEIAINSIPDVPIWDSKPVTVGFTLSEFDESSTSSTVLESRFNELKQKYSDFPHIYTDGFEFESWKLKEKCFCICLSFWNKEL